MNRAAYEASRDVDWTALERFIGFGNLRAPVVFIGLEPPLPDATKVHADVLARSRFAPVMDAEVAHRDLAKGPQLFTDRPRPHRTWAVMADLMLHHENAPLREGAERATDRQRYRSQRLGRAGGESLLIDLLPYPHANVKQWLYAPYGRHPTRQAYEAAVLDERIALVRDALGAAPRRAIVCYGRGDWKRFKRLFPEARWESAARFQSAVVGGTRVTLCEHLSRPSFTTDSQLDELAAAALGA